jgi:F-type H+-transporting ATPase subunit epsilon
MARTLRLEIVTPEAKAYSEDVDMVVLPGTDGELGVYPQHVPVLTTLKPGELRVIKSGQETSLAVGEGFAEITGDSISVLTDMALESTVIDESAAEAAVARAQAAMKGDLGAEKSPPSKRRCKKRWPNCASSAVTNTNPGKTPSIEMWSDARRRSQTLLCSHSSRCVNSAVKLLPLMETLETLGIIAGSGVYPLLLADAARVAGVKKVIVAAFTDETSPEIS